VSVELRLGACVRRFGMLVVESLLEAAPDSGEGGLGCGALRWIAAWDGMVRCVGGATSTMDLEEGDGVEKTPGWLKVLPFLEG